MSANDFVCREFHKPLPQHRHLKHHNEDELELDDPKYKWQYFGETKYGRYAVCQNTQVKRGLTMGEFYGSGVVD